MNKKHNYISPNIIILNVQPQTILAGSGPTGASGSSSMPSVGGSRESSGWEDGDE